MSLYVTISGSDLIATHLFKKDSTAKGVRVLVSIVVVLIVTFLPTRVVFLLACFALGANLTYKTDMLKKVL